jgi:hypothetical protein
LDQGFKKDMIWLKKVLGGRGQKIIKLEIKGVKQRDIGVLR